MSLDDSFSFLFASNAAQVLSELHNCEDSGLPCLMILDYNMPDSNAAEILEALKKEGRYEAIPKIIWSTSRSDTFRNRCLELGATDYLVKPSNVSEMLGICKYMLSV